MTDEQDPPRHWHSTNLVGAPAPVLASTACNTHPVPLRIAGAREAHGGLFALLERCPSLGGLLRCAVLGAGRKALAHEAYTWIAAWPVFRFQPYPGHATAYVVDTVQTVLHHCLAHEDPQAALVATVNRGDDADTTGALVGMLADDLRADSPSTARRA